MSRAHHVTPALVELTGPDGNSRGRQRGELSADRVRESWSAYAGLFEVSQVPAEAVRRAGLRSLAALEEWAPDLAAEVRGTATGAGLPEWQAAALNARTEILSMGTVPAPGECSTIVRATAPVVSAQTWDWHEDLMHLWHVQRVASRAGGFVGLTEYGMLAKIGINAAGVGVHFNVLGHREDRPGAVPVHAAAAQVLHLATTLDEAVDLLLSAPVHTSTAVTIVTERAAATVELSPSGSGLVRADTDYLLHTNHFLHPRLAPADKGTFQPDSGLRFDLLRQRCAAEFDPREVHDLVGYLCSTPADGADLCLIPEPTAAPEHRWASLATILIDPARRAMYVSPGASSYATPDTWQRFEAEAAVPGAEKLSSG